MYYVSIKDWYEGREPMPFISENIDDITDRIIYAFPEQPSEEQLKQANNHYNNIKGFVRKYPGMFKNEYVRDEYSAVVKVINYYQGGNE